MTQKIFCFIALSFFMVACNAQETKKALDVVIKEDLKSYLLSQYDDIKIAEVYSKDSDKERSNKKSYLQKSLGDALLKEARDIKAQDIYFKELTATTETHLGVAYFYYETPDKAKKAIANLEPEGFFENTKILTKYVVVNVDAVNLVVYTESAGNKTVLGYLDSIAKKDLTGNGE
jgi:hypothetical protein